MRALLLPFTLLLLCVAVDARAQNALPIYPARPVRIIVS